MYSISFENNTVFIRGQIKIATIPALEAELRPILKQTSGIDLTLDLAGVEEIDSIGVAFLEEIIQTSRQANQVVSLSHPLPHIEQAIRNFSTGDLIITGKPERIGLFERLGEKILNAKARALNLLYLVADIFYWAGVGLIDHKGQRKGTFLQQSLLIGADSVKIVAMISLLIGFILALQSASQLRQFGANIYIADLIGISMTAEMGPIMTAIILAGRSGSAFASEIATMVVTEEIDALKTMGLNPIRFIVVPKFHAITLCLPLLTIMADFIGIFGGFIIGVTYLELSPTVFINELLTVVFLIDIISGIVKSIVFAWIIVIVGSYCGFSVTGGAEGVGKVTTASVVISIFVIIIADSILGLLFYFGRPMY